MTRSAASPVEVVGDGPLARMVRAQVSGFPRSPDNVGRVTFVDCGDDLATIESARAHVMSGVRVLAVVRDRRLRRAAQARFESEAPGPFPTLIGPDQIEAERYAAQCRLERFAWARGHAALHVAIIGFGAFGEACFDALATVGLAAGLGRPRFLILAEDVEAAATQLWQAAPEIEASLDVDFAALRLRDLGDAERSPLVAAERAAPLTAILLAAESREDAVAGCLAVVELQERHGLAQAALVLGGAGRRVVTDCVAPRRAERDLGRSVSRMEGLDEIDLAKLLFEDRDRAGRRLHEAYRAEFGAPDTPDWDRLAETYRRANRRAAAHVAQKLWSLGVDPEPGEVLRVDPATYEAVVRPCIEGDFEDATVRGLARIEHDRWSTDRRLDGWVFAAQRDDLRRRHPCLVDFDDPRLSAGEIAKDIAQVRFVFQTIVEPYTGGARARLTIGATSESAERAVAELAPQALVSLIEGQPWRMPVILSALVTEDERRAVAELVAALDARGLEHRLVVLVPQDGVTPAHSEAQALLMADHRAWIAPIGTPDSSAVGWIDQSGAATPVDTLFPYLLARCNVWLTIAA